MQRKRKSNCPCQVGWLYRVLLPARKYCIHMETCTSISDELRAVNLGLCSAHIASKGEGPLSYPTCCDTWPRFWLWHIKSDSIFYFRSKFSILIRLTLHVMILNTVLPLMP